LVGAADLHVSRSIFYNKRLNFITAYSYGAGRAEYNFENGINKSDIIHKSGLPIDELFRRAVYLIDNDFISFESISCVQLTKDTDLDKILEDKALGYFFNWEQLAGGEIPKIEQPKTSVSTAIEPMHSIDVYGYSNFFKDSHLPALKNLKVTINNIFTHTPKSDHPHLGNNSNGIIVSTPHGEHLQCIKNSSGYGVIFVDKPVVSNLAEITDYLGLVDSSLIIGLMSRRYSDYIAIAKNFVTDTAIKSDLYMKLVFNVETKTQQDRIYYEGGRVIGEMVHHLDLAIDLLGEIDEISFFDFDESEYKQMSENVLLVMRHRSGATSKIEYVTKSSAMFEKEFISISTGESSIAICDFKNIQSKNFDIIETSETDKGVCNMWTLYKEKMESGDNQYFVNLMNKDIYVYKILKHILG
jgi:predicted dehydrogenase